MEISCWIFGLVDTGSVETGFDFVERRSCCVLFHVDSKADFPLFVNYRVALPMFVYRRFRPLLDLGRFGISVQPCP